MKVSELGIQHRGLRIKVIGPRNNWTITGVLEGLSVQVQMINIREISSGHEEQVAGQAEITLQVSGWCSGPLHPDTKCELYR